VGTDHNLPHITAIHEYLGDLGVRSFHILPLMPLGRARASGGVPASVMTTAYVALIHSFLRNPHLPREDRLHLLVRRFISNDESHLTEVDCQSGIKPCGKQLIFLDSSGRIFPCSYATKDTLRLGDALSDRVCWSASEDALETHVLEDEYSIRCLTCRARAICGFSCAAVNVADQWAREIACEFYQSLMECFLAERPMIDRLYSMWNEEDERYGNNSNS
jgi:radical SAM protein with 4Fe4S-binding SPASM domain